MSPQQMGTLIPLVAICVGGLIAVISIIAGSARSIAVRRAREDTKRELAAYVAEGTLDPDKAIAMLNAGEPPGNDMVAGKEKGSCRAMPQTVT